MVAFAAVFFILMAIYNGLIYLMSQNNRDKWYNSYVHKTGFVIRCLFGVLILSLYIYTGIRPVHTLFMILLMLFLSGPVYNIIYNFMHDHPVFYIGSSQSGTSSFIDRWLSNWRIPWVVPAYILSFLSVVLWYPLKMFSVVERIWLNFQLNFISYLIAAAIGVLAFYGVRKIHRKPKNI
jgi:hypothetical protein